MIDELKTCPFCGSNDQYIVKMKIDYEAPFMSADDYTVGIFCNTCKQMVILEDNEMEGFNDDTVRRAIAAWNRRVE